MRYLAGFVCVFALAMMPLVGCEPDNGGPTTCVPACVDLDEDDCTEPICPEGATECSTQPAPEASDCRANSADGKCALDGRCDLCADETCAAPSQCQEDSSCNEDTGVCLPFENKAQGTPCAEGGGSYCDGNGRCVQCNVADDCDPGGECTATVCAAGTCDTQRAQDGTSCDYSASGDGTCTSGMCGPTTCVPACVDLDEDDCTEPICPEGATECSTQPAPEHSDCDEDGGSYCDADGNCVQCTLPGHCADGEECTDDDCANNDRCENIPKADGALCSQGACLGGVCGNVFPCTEQGIRDAITKGGGPYRFACPQDGRTVELSQPLILDQGVILNGESRLELRAAFLRRVFSVLVNVDATLIGIGMRDGYDDDSGGCISNAGSLELVSVVVRNCQARNGGGIWSSGTLTVVNSMVSGNTADDDGGGINNNGTLTLTNSTVSGNTASYGGGINNNGTLTLTNSTVSDNTAKNGGGGGIINGGTLTLTDSRVSDNTADGGGGGIINGGTLTLTDSTVSTNTAENGSGGGIYNYGGTLTLTNSTVSGNAAPAGGGGGIINGATLTVLNSTVSGNTADGSGGGIFNFDDGTLTLTNSTVSGNTTDFHGGGINNNGTLTLTNSAVSGNTAENGNGGGINNNGTLTVLNSTVSGNVSPAGGAILNSLQGAVAVTNTVIDGDCAGDITSGGYNIESGDTCGFGVSNAELRLGALADNDGPTETHALLPGSPAINVIPAAECELDTDQRGQPRPETGGTMCDVGAFEAQP